MSTTTIVEPYPNGHRFQYVAHLVRRVNAIGGKPVLLTSSGATTTREFQNHLAELPLDVREVFAVPRPDAWTITAALAAGRYDRGDVVVVPEADLLLWWWWLAFLRHFGLRRDRPRVSLLLLGFPICRRPGDLRDLARIVIKVVLGVLTKLVRSARHVFALVGAGQAPRGWILERVRDPAICGAHSRDRAALRRRLALPTDRLLVGAFGFLDERKNLPLLLDVVERVAVERDAPIALVAAGTLSTSVQQWVDTLDEARRRRLIVRGGHLDDEELDAHVAAVDVVATAQGNNGPSGVMGKALAAGTPVLTAGSLVRAHEVRVMHAGVHRDLDVASLADGLQRVLDGGWYVSAESPALPTAEEFAARLLVDLPSDNQRRAA